MTITFKSDLLGQNPDLAALLVNDIKAYWVSHINEYFSKSERNYNVSMRASSVSQGHTGQLASSCMCEIIGGNTLIVSMKPIYGRDGKDYGIFLRKGRGTSPGKYIPSIDARIKLGVTEGFTAQPWRDWMTDFRTYVRMRRDQFVRDALKRGVLKRQ